MSETLTTPSFNIFGEFKDSTLEHSYQENNAAQNRWRMTMICIITSVVYFLAIGIDIIDKVSGIDLIIMFAARAVTFVLGITAAVFAWNKQLFRIFPFILMTYMCTIGITESLEVAMNFDMGNNIILPTAVIIVLMYYLFVPVHLLHSLIPSVFMSSLYILTVTYFTNADMGYIINLLLSFVLVNAYGIVHVTTFNRIRRKEFLALNEQRRLNDELQKEILIRQEAEIKLHELATKDELTGVYNRRFFMDMFNKEFNRSMRYSYPLSLMMIDADHFKSINDQYGHDAGDSALIHLTDLIGKELRHTDILARFGGEEFSILLPSTNLDNAREAAKRICTAISETPFDTGGTPVSLTVSIGVITLCDECNSLETMLKTADEALYKAKDNGRNNVVTMSDLGYTTSSNTGEKQ